ncbi:phage portal protein [Vibrio vulnificus]|uniref:phage portal protein n=1 Tax=Vibrio vulnificus TaxID=672 RepID=UPI0024DF853F|nr:phage portal protein [Vibrio vulnificus]MDK2679232.1 phage portal protein [Vibrio vulnificus]MDK2688039.1 phage portal protein [Vibrio vulnificus]
MNWMEKGIALFAPQWAAKRMRAKVAIHGYEAAMPTHLRKNKSERRSGNQAVKTAGKTLREQARYLDENHDMVIGIFDKLEERIVGAEGIMIEPQPLNQDGTVNQKFADELRRRWASWSLKPEVTGTYSRPELERLVLRTAVRDGECFGQLVRGRVAGLKHPNPNGTAFSIEALEPDFVPFELNDPAKKIRQGIRTNGWGQPQGYQVLYDHPGEVTGIKFKTKEVSADAMLHVAFRRRLHQLRGVTLIHGIINRLNDIKDYEEAERVAARIAACLGFYIKKNAVDDGEDYDTPEKRTHLDIAPGMVYDDLQPGEDLGMVSSNRPNVHLADFRNGQVRMVAAGSRSQYSSVARDYNGTYSAQRQELVESWEGFAVLQNWFVSGWSRPVYREWLRMEMLNGLSIPPDLDLRTLFDAVYLAPVMPWINPVHETQAWKERVKGGAASTAQWIRAGNKNPSETWRQIEAERKFFQEHDLHFDTLTQQGDSGDNPKPKSNALDDERSTSDPDDPDGTFEA